MNDTPITPAPFTFNQWLDVIEQYRDLGCPLPNPREKGKWSAEEAAWMSSVEGGLKSQWKATAKAFEVFKSNEQLWDGVNAPLKQEEEDPKKPKTLYGKIMMGLQFTASIMTPPFSAAFMQWAMESDYLPRVLHDIAQLPNDDVHYDKFRADMLEAFGNDLRTLGDSRMLNDERNNTYVTKNSKGEWVTLDSTQVAQMLQKSAANEGPHVIITANHAFLETMGDLDPITTGYADLVNEVTKGEATLKPLDQAGSNDTVMIAALNTRANNFLNLAQLFQRLYDVDMADKGDPRKDTFENVSPIAMMMVETLLKAAAESPEHVKLDNTKRPPTFNATGQPIRLRADAPDVIRKALFFGFSKGGNDFRDGMRLLVRTLDSQLSDGRAQFEAAPGTSVWDIVANTSVTVQSMNEKPMHGYYRGYRLNEDGSVVLDEKGKPIKLHEGAAVTYFTNAHDTIAVSPDIQTTEDDRAVVYDGSKASSGHHPGVITENLYQHPYIMQHHRCVLAPTCGKPAIRFVLYQKFPEPTPEDPNHKRHGLVIKTSTGTTDKLFEKVIPTIERALAERDLGHIRITRIPDTHGSVRYELRSSLGEDNLLNPITLERLIQVFEDLRDAKNGIVISSAVHYPNLSTLKKDVTAAKWRFSEAVAEQRGIKDWKDLIEITGDKIYDHNIAQANTLAAQGQTFYLPERWDLKPEKVALRA